MAWSSLPAENSSDAYPATHLLNHEGPKVDFFKNPTYSPKNHFAFFGSTLELPGHFTPANTILTQTLTFLEYYRNVSIEFQDHWLNLNLCKS